MSRHAAPRSNPRAGLVPDLAELVALRELVRAWPPPVRSSAAQQGPANSALRGRGMEYAESRPYSPGDEVRRIDWRVTARTGKPHTKLYHAERERVSLLVCDTSSRLFFGTRVRFKSVQAARAGALMAWAAERAGDRVGAIVAGAGVTPVPPGRGTPGVLRVLGALAGWYTAPPESEPGFEHAIRTARRLAHSGARVLLLADAASIEAVPGAELAALGLHADVACVLLEDALEVAPPRRGLAFAGPASRLEIDLSRPDARQAWKARFEGRAEVQGARLGELRIACRRLATDGPLEPLLTLWQRPGEASA